MKIWTLSFGEISATSPERVALGKFRIALFGDFSGRAASGVIETGAALAQRRPVQLDVDTIEDVIEGFATKLILPLGANGAGIEVQLNDLDDLHPDELFENVEIFNALSSLKQRLNIGSMFEKAAQELQSWGEAHRQKVKLPKRSGANTIPADCRLSDFQALIGDDVRQRRSASVVEDILARVVGPHIKAAPTADVEAMQAAVDDALSTAMRLVLHHPDFQAVEAQWRSIDLLVRSIETDESLEIVLFDVSAEEIATDLAAGVDLTQSGIFGLLDQAAASSRGSGAGTGVFSALFGLYTFEETPPHAELLGRVAKIAAHHGAPFFTAISPTFLDQALGERHPLVASAWDRLRNLPESDYLGIVSPRFMLRRPYGAKSDPISAFKFEEFTNAEGLSGILWANPVVLVAILLAKTFSNDGPDMALGSVMSLGDIPFHLVNDRYGDQVALPCTERNLTGAKMDVAERLGIMPVLSMKGSDEIRLASFQGIRGNTIAGPWDGPRRSDALDLALQKSKEKPVEYMEPVISDSDNAIEVGSELSAAKPDPVDELNTEVLEANSAELDELLAKFGDENEADDDEDDMIDAELAALLEGL